MPKTKQKYENGNEQVCVRLDKKYSAFFKDYVKKSGKSMNHVFNDVVRALLVKEKYITRSGKPCEGVEDNSAADEAISHILKKCKTWREAVFCGKDNKMSHDDILDFVFDNGLIDCEEDEIYIEYHNYIAPWEESEWKSCLQRP